MKSLADYGKRYFEAYHAQHGEAPPDPTPPTPREAMLARARRADALAERAKAKRAPSGQFDRKVDCTYCLDETWLRVPTDWLDDGRIIPGEESTFWDLLTVSRPFCGIPGRATADTGMTMIACDCHRGFIGDGERRVVIKKFVDYFGQMIGHSDYGQLLLATRRQRAADRQAV